MTIFKVAIMLVDLRLLGTIRSRTVSLVVNLGLSAR
jgi:hypothetical protein